MPEADCRDAWEFWTHFINGKELPDRILIKTGMPITEQNDLRIQYMQEELSVFQKIDSEELAEDKKEEDSSSCEKSAEIINFSQKYGEKHPAGPHLFFEQIAMPSLWETEKLSLAAGNEKCNIFVNCKISGFNDFITFEYAPQEEKLRLKIYDTSKSALSSAFDGWDLIDVYGESLARISGGKCVIQNLKQFDGKCTFRNPEGTVFILECISE